MTNPSRVAFTVFGKDVYWYGVLMAVGIVIAVMLAIKESKRKRFAEDTMIDLCLIMIPLGIIFARAYYVLFELDMYLDDPIRMLYIWEGGLAIYGAILGGMLGMFIYSRKKKLRMLRLLDCCAPGLVLAQAIGRWGNFFNQEAFGNPVTDPNLMWFPLTVKIDVPWLSGYHTFNGVPCDNPYHLATFFYESLWCFIVFIILWSNRKKFKHDGDAFIVYGILYGIERAVVEGLRGDSLWLIPDVIRVSQMLSIIVAVIGIIFLLVRRAHEKKIGALCWPAPLPEPAADADTVDAADADAVEVEADADTEAMDEAEEADAEVADADSDAADADADTDASSDADAEDANEKGE